MKNKLLYLVVMLMVGSMAACSGQPTASSSSSAPSSSSSSAASSEASSTASSETSSAASSEASSAASSEASSVASSEASSAASSETTASSSSQADNTLMTAQADSPVADATTPADTSSKKALDGGAMVVSPMSDYDSVLDMNAATGFSALEIAKVTGFEPYAYSTISGEIAQILLKNSSGDEMCLRAYKGTDDQSGVMGVTYKDKVMTIGDTKDIKVHLGSITGTQVAWFTVGDMSYSISVTSQTATLNDLEVLITYLVF